MSAEQRALEAEARGLVEHVADVVAALHDAASRDFIGFAHRLLAGVAEGDGDYFLPRRGVRVEFERQRLEDGFLVHRAHYAGRPEYRDAARHAEARVEGALRRLFAARHGNRNLRRLRAYDGAQSLRYHRARHGVYRGLAGRDFEPRQRHCADALAAREGYLSGLAAELDVREYQQAVGRVGVVARVLHDAAAARRVMHRYREDAPARRGYLDGLRADAVEQLHRRGLRRSRRARARRYSFAEIFIVCHRAERSLSRRRPSSRPCVPSPRCTARPCARAAPSTRRR